MESLCNFIFDNPKIKDQRWALWRKNKKREKNYRNYFFRKNIGTIQLYFLWTFWNIYLVFSEERINLIDWFGDFFFLKEGSSYVQNMFLSDVDSLGNWRSFWTCIIVWIKHPKHDLVCFWLSEISEQLPFFCCGSALCLFIHNSLCKQHLKNMK